MAMDVEESIMLPTVHTKHVMTSIRPTATNVDADADATRIMVFLVPVRFCCKRETVRDLGIYSSCCWMRPTGKRYLGAPFPTDVRYGVSSARTADRPESQ